MKKQFLFAFSSALIAGMTGAFFAHYMNIQPLLSGLICGLIAFFISFFGYNWKETRGMMKKQWSIFLEQTTKKDFEPLNFKKTIENIENTAIALWKFTIRALFRILQAIYGAFITWFATNMALSLFIAVIITKINASDFLILDASWGIVMLIGYPLHFRDQFKLYTSTKRILDWSKIWLDLKNKFSTNFLIGPRILLSSILGLLGLLLNIAKIQTNRGITVCISSLIGAITGFGLSYTHFPFGINGVLKIILINPLVGALIAGVLSTCACALQKIIILPATKAQEWLIFQSKVAWNSICTETE